MRRCNQKMMKLRVSEDDSQAEGDSDADNEVEGGSNCVTQKRKNETAASSHSLIDTIHK